MADITLKGNPIHTVGELPAVGSTAPDFRLTTGELGELSLSDLRGKRVILNISPSLDTGICATSIQRFNEAAADLENTEVVYVSMDLPFAQQRFCGAEGIEKVRAVSDFRSGAFGRDYGVRMADGPMAGLLARSVVVIDEGGKVAYTQLVPEIVQEPDYDQALEAARG